MAKIIPQWTRLRSRRSQGLRQASVIERTTGDLENLNRSTEQDFLAVGGKLMELRSGARRIFSEMAFLTELIDGDQGNSATQSLSRIQEFSQAMNAALQDSGHVLETVGQLGGRLRHALDGLPGTVALFRVLCTLTRIETSRLGAAGAGFFDLADEVKPLSESIAASGERVLDAASVLDQGVQSALRLANHSRTTQLREVAPLAAAILESAGGFDDRQRRSREAAVVQAAQQESICAAIDGVVRSIQFHDITRQQIEHAVEALRQLKPGEAIRPVLSLQISQLKGARRAFTSAMEVIERDLESIAGRLQAMTEASRSLMGVSEAGHTSFFLHMEACLTDILRAVAACSAAQDQIRSASGAIETGVARMRESLAEILGVDILIQRISINATLRAVHLGVPGRPLDIIAEAMQRVVAGSQTNTAAAAAALDEIGDAACRLRAGSVDGRAAAASIDQMRQSILQLHSAGEQSFTRVNQIVGLGTSLAADLSLLRGGLSAGRLFTQVVDRVCEELEAFAAELPAGEEAPVQVEELALRYTMQTEREIHRHVIEGEPSPPHAEEILGDNVELF